MSLLHFQNQKVETPRYLNPSGGCPRLEAVIGPLLITCVITWAVAWKKGVGPYWQGFWAKPLKRRWPCLSCDLLTSPEIRCEWWLRCQGRDLNTALQVADSCCHKSLPLFNDGGNRCFFYSSFCLSYSKMWTLASSDKCCLSAESCPVEVIDSGSTTTSGVLNTWDWRSLLDERLNI